MRNLLFRDRVNGYLNKCLIGKCSFHFKIAKCLNKQSLTKLKLIQAETFQPIPKGNSIFKSLFQRLHYLNRILQS